MIYGDRETKIPDVNAIIQSNNLYAYCMNNPVNFADTSGESVDLAIAALYTYVQAIISSPDLQYDMEMIAFDISEGDYLSAAFDAVDILIPAFSGSKAIPKVIRKHFDDIVGGVKTPGLKAISNVSSKRISHILNGSKGHDHLWRTVTNNVNWRNVKKFISDTIDTGTVTSVKPYVNNSVTTMVYTSVKNFNGRTVEVEYNVINGVIDVTNAWVKP